MGYNKYYPRHQTSVDHVNRIEDQPVFMGPSWFPDHPTAWLYLVWYCRKLHLEAKNLSFWALLHYSGTAWPWASLRTSQPKASHLYNISLGKWGEEAEPNCFLNTISARIWRCYSAWFWSSWFCACHSNSFELLGHARKTWKWHLLEWMLARALIFRG